MKMNTVELPKKVLYPYLTESGYVTFARTKKDVRKENYETIYLPDWLVEAIKERIELESERKVNEFKNQVKNLFS
jgi:hypothetical protein